MSADALNGQQFQQLDMIKPVDWVIDNANKIDYRGEATDPRAQWEGPQFDYATKETQPSLKDNKLANPFIAERSRKTGLFDQRHDATITAGNSGPIALGNSGSQQPDLVDGHHRLAWTEHLGHTEIPVVHRFAEHAGVDEGYSERDFTPDPDLPRFSINTLRKKP